MRSWLGRRVSWLRRWAVALWTLLSSSDFRVSLREHGQRVRQRGWVLIVTGVGGVLGLIALTVPPSTGKHPGPLIPTWLWVSLIVVGVVVAQFLAFHDVRKERDAVKADMRSRFDSIRYRFQMHALRGMAASRIAEVGSPEDGYRFWFEFLNGGTEALEYEVERMSITIGSHTSPLDLDLESASAIILPGRLVEFYYNWIPAPIDQLLTGAGEYSVVYGHPSGGTRFRTKHKFVIGWTENRDPQGNFLGREINWVTQGRITHEPVE
jgi:hypothetical protein